MGSSSGQRSETLNIGGEKNFEDDLFELRDSALVSNTKTGLYHCLMKYTT